MEAMFTYLSDPTAFDPDLTAARRGSFEALSREATKQQRQAAQAVDSVLAEGIPLHDFCFSVVRA
eukprot:11156757-Lingulodinium_polyedra.AAC.1